MSTDQEPTITTGLSIAETANRLGISENAVRQRIKRGTLDAVKVDGIWQVSLSGQADYETDHEATSGRDHEAGYQDRPAADYEATTSVPAVSTAARAQLAAIRDEFVQPLVEQIAAQAEQIGRLRAERDALQATLDRRQEQDTATTPRVVAQDASGEPAMAQNAPQAGHMAPDTARGLWARLMALIRGTNSGVSSL